MKILVVSDVHEDELAVKELSEYFEPSAIFDCGDHNIPQDLAHLESAFMFQDIPRYFIYGNHAPSWIKDVARENVPFSKGNLHYLPSGKISKITIDNEELLVGAFGGNYSSEFSELSATYADAERLRNSPSGLDVLLLHDSPFISPQIKDSHIETIRLINEVISLKSPSYVFSGHIHKYIEQSFEGLNTLYVSLSYPIVTAGLLESDSSGLQYRRLFHGKDFKLSSANWPLVSKQLSALKKEFPKDS